jgi:hypothetical protein
MIGGAALIGQRHGGVWQVRFGWSGGRSWENRARFGFGSGEGGCSVGRGWVCPVLSVRFCWFLSSGERMLGDDSFFFFLFSRVAMWLAVGDVLTVDMSSCLSVALPPFSLSSTLPLSLGWGRTLVLLFFSFLFWMGLFFCCCICSCLLAYPPP